MAAEGAVACWYSYTYETLPATVSATPTYQTYNWSFYATLAPGCSSPTGNERDIVYNQNYHTLQYCSEVSWIPLGQGSGGGGRCSNQSGIEDNIRYNTDYHTYQYCNGTNWVKFGGGSSVLLPTCSDGYFVMSKSKIG